MFETIVTFWIGGCFGCLIMWVFHAKDRRWARQLGVVKVRAQLAYQNGETIPYSVWQVIALYEME